MKIGISVMGDNLQALVNKRFGRAEGFLIYDVENANYIHLSNEQNVLASHGAGIQTAQLMVQNGVSAVITGNVGPKAMQVLSAANIKMYAIEEDLTVEQAILKFKSNALREILN